MRRIKTRVYAEKEYVLEKEQNNRKISAPIGAWGLVPC